MHELALCKGIHDGLGSADRSCLLTLFCVLDPLLPIDLYQVGLQRGDGSLNNLGHHGEVLMGLLQLGCRDPDLSVRGDVLTSLVKNLGKEESGEER